MVCLHAPNQGEIKARSHASGAVRRLLLPNRPLSVRLGSQIPSCNASFRAQPRSCSPATPVLDNGRSARVSKPAKFAPNHLRRASRASAAQSALEVAATGRRRSRAACHTVPTNESQNLQASAECSQSLWPRWRPRILAALAGRRPCRDPTSHNPGARPAKGGIARSYRQTRSITHPGQCSISREPGVHIPPRLLSQRKTTSISARRRAAAQRLLRRAPGPRSWPRTLLPSRMRVQ